MSGEATHVQPRSQSAPHWVNLAHTTRLHLQNHSAGQGGETMQAYTAPERAALHSPGTKLALGMVPPRAATVQGMHNVFVVP